MTKRNIALTAIGFGLTAVVYVTLNGGKLVKLLKVMVSEGKQSFSDSMNHVHTYASEVGLEETKNMQIIKEETRQGYWNRQ
ncbi:MAG: hypothetical protein FWD33_04215 [Alphaproteobacteria bacterium]|nr:hypothetical protein [Alphaproteobacteria bacterium]